MDTIRLLVQKNYHIGLIEHVTRLPSSGNQTFLVHASSGDFVIRFNPTKGPQAREKEEVMEEVLFLHYLQQCDIPVGEVIPTRSNDFLVDFEGSYGFLRRFLSGEALGNPNKEQIAMAGEMLGSIHRASETYVPTYLRAHKWDLERVGTYWQENKVAILASDVLQAQDFVHSFEEKLKTIIFPNTLPSGMLHEDFGKRHILWKQGKIVGVIDFDRSYVGPFILDIGQAIRGWCTNQEEVGAFLEGYECSRMLHDLELDVLEQAIVFAFLERAQAFLMRGIKEQNVDLIESAMQELQAIL